MSRPVNADAAATQSRLIETAVQHFALHGAEATSLRKVATEAGVSLATVHYYFGTKSRLYDACIESLHGSIALGLAPMQEMFAEITEQLDDAQLDISNLNEMVETLVRLGFGFARGHQDLLRLIMRPLIEGGELDARWRERTLVPFLDATAEALGKATKSSPADLRFAVQTIVAVGMRYALSSPKELVQLNGLHGKKAKISVALKTKAIQITEDRLVRLAQEILLGPLSAPSIQ